MSTTTADTASTTATYSATDTATDTATDQREAGPLRRSADDRMLGGVAGGIARYLDVDVTLVRVGIAALTLLTGAGAALYIAAWLLLPADGEDQSIAAAWVAARRNPVR
jgi:phage shock protein PspC (stress-responsive transcriptional regulator)